MSPRIAVQLYTLRDEPEPQLRATLARLASIGYEGVETAGFWGLEPARFRKCCDEAGLEIAAAHSPLVHGDAALETCQRLARAGIDAWVIPMLEAPCFGNLGSLEAAAAQLAALLEVAQAQGVTLGYHNHEWEFEQRIDGVPAHHVLFEALDPAIFAEIDVYWAQVGGVDPAEEIARLGRRATLLHLKDGPASDSEAPMTALGQGRVDLPRVLRCSQAEWHILEIDRCEGDVWDAIEASAAYLAAQ